MKSKTIILMYAIVIAGMLGSCKKETVTTEKEPEIAPIAANEKTQITILNSLGTVTVPNSNLITNGHITGDLQLNNGMIEAVIKLKVRASEITDEKYTFAGTPIIINENGNKALIFRYQNEAAQTDEGDDEIMDVAFSFPNVYKWEKEDNIRIMCLNENDPDTFLSLIPYYIFRMNKFGTDQVDDLRLKKLNSGWNNTHHNLRVRSYLMSDKDLGDLEIDTPKLAKGDLIVKL